MPEAAKARNSVVVPQLAWCGDIDAELVFPDKWEVVTCTWAGAAAPRLSDLVLISNNPYGEVTHYLI